MNGIMNFFIPQIEDSAKAENFYQSLKADLEKRNRQISDKRFYSIQLWDGKEPKSITVGYRYYKNNEIVISIFFDEIRKQYYIITPNYGVDLDNPMMVDNLNTIKTELFKNV